MLYTTKLKGQMFNLMKWEKHDMTEGAIDINNKSILHGRVEGVVIGSTVTAAMFAITMVIKKSL